MTAAGSDVSDVLRDHMVHLREALSNFGRPLNVLVRARLERPSKIIIRPDSGDSVFEERSQLAQPNHKLSPGEVDELEARYEAGESIRGLGRAFDLHEQTVRAHLRRRGVKLRPIRVLSERQIQEAARLYETGWSTFRLADLFGVGATTMGLNLKTAGVQLRPRGWKRSA